MIEVSPPSSGIRENPKGALAQCWKALISKRVVLAETK
jgi:hypothetical protein